MVDDLLDELHGLAICSKIDLLSDYNQIRMELFIVPKTTFKNHDGHYEYVIVSFRLPNALAFMNVVFQKFVRKILLVFFMTFSSILRICSNIYNI